MNASTPLPEPLSTAPEVLTADDVPVYSARDMREALAAVRDCRTCSNFNAILHCHSALRCVNGSSYKRGGIVQIWETAPVDAGF